MSTFGGFGGWGNRCQNIISHAHSDARVDGHPGEVEGVTSTPCNEDDSS